MSKEKSSKKRPRQNVVKSQLEVKIRCKNCVGPYCDIKPIKVKDCKGE